MEEHCRSGDYAGKTLMFCWEHKNIPYIVARFGLTDHGINWGLDPDSGVGSQDTTVTSVSSLLLLQIWSFSVMQMQAVILSSMCWSCALTDVPQSTLCGHSIVLCKEDICWIAG